MAACHRAERLGRRSHYSWCGGIPGAAELPPPTEQFVRFVQTAEVDWTDAGSVIEYPVEYQRVLAGTERPFDKAAARQRGGWLREPIQATGDHRLHARRNRRVRLQCRTAVPKIIGYRDLATLVIAIERDHDRRRGAHTATKEAAIVLTA